VVLRAEKAGSITQAGNVVTPKVAVAADLTPGRKRARMQLAPLKAGVDPIRKRIQELVSLLIGQLGFLLGKPQQIRVGPSNLLLGCLYCLLFLHLAHFFVLTRLGLLNIGLAKSLKWLYHL
jgi:hypothetical protein